MNSSLSSTVKSSWTPLKKGTPTNEQEMEQFELYLEAIKRTHPLFEERRALLFKWWQKWSNDQRIVILHDLLNNSKVEQKSFAETHLKKNFPARQVDFTRTLPRHLSLYIFSFLDPRSLCRCSQVCWFWKYLTEEDTLWMVKCVRFGWDLDFKPTPFEVGIWKRNYIRRVEELVMNNPKLLNLRLSQTQASLSGTFNRWYNQRYSDPGDSSSVSFAKTKGSTKNSRGHEDVSPVRTSTRKGVLGTTGGLDMTPPPWKANDRKPTDIVRYNFLDNDDADKSQFLFAEKRQKALQIKQESTKKSYGSAHGKYPLPGCASRHRDSHSGSSSASGFRPGQSLSTASDMMKSLTLSTLPKSRPVTSSNPQLRSILRNSTNSVSSGSVAVFGPPVTLGDETTTLASASSVWGGDSNLRHEPAEKESDVTINRDMKTPEPSLDNDPSGVGVSGDQRSTTVTDDPREKLRRSTATSLVTRSNRDPPSHDLFPTRPWTLVNAEDSD